MRRQLQIKDGKAQSEWQGSGGMPIAPDDSWTFVDVTDRPEATAGMLYDAGTDTFSAAPVPPRTRVTKSQVVSVLTPAEWATATSNTDPDVVWAMAQFQLADAINLADPLVAQIFAGLVAKNIVSAARATEIQAALSALAT